jgi:hypothetical protein
MLTTGEIWLYDRARSSSQRHEMRAQRLRVRNQMRISGNYQLAVRPLRKPKP